MTRTSRPSAEQTLEVYRYFFGAYPKRSLLMVGLMCLAGMAEGVGVITFIPVLESIQPAGQPERGPSAIINAALRSVGLEPTLPILLALIVVAIIGKALTLMMANRQVGYTIARAVTDLRLDLMRALMGARWSYFTERRAGHFANAIAAEALRAGKAYQEACGSLATAIQIVAYLVVATLISPWVAGGALVVGLILAVVGRHFFGTTRLAGRSQTASLRELIARLVDVLQGIKPIKAMSREGLVWPLLEQETEKLNQAQRDQVSSAAWISAAQEPILVLALAGGVYVAVEVYGILLSSVLVLAFVFYRVVGYMNVLQNRYQLMLIGESAFSSLQAEIAQARARPEDSTGSLPFTQLAEAVTFENVVFRYGDTTVLDGLILSIPVGEFVSVHGESGAGKTTIADLILRLREPDSGQVLVDGVPLTKLDLSEWRRSIGYVPQEVLLFHDSVLMNVTLGDPAFSRGDVQHALELAGAWDFVQSRPEGLDATIGASGGMLSGGQRQRIAIARALVGRPSILILDEVTAALDPDTERAICETLRELTGDVTIFSISHQPALREVATIVYELRGGRVELTTGSMAT